MRVSRIIKWLIALAFVGGFVWFAVPPFFRTVPRLAQGVTFNDRSDVDRDGRNIKFTARLRDEFPPDSPASALEIELQREGWGPVMIDNINKSKHPWRAVQFRRPIPVRPFILGYLEVTTIMWKVDEGGRILDIAGGYRWECTYCL